MSPSQLLDQAGDYFRNSSGRAYLHNLRDEIVSNPVPIALVGAGIAWLALSGAIGRRGHGRAHDPARDRGRSAGIADDLAHGGHGPSATQRAKDTARAWAHEAGDAVSETEERWRERAEDAGDRASTAYDETVARARQAAEGWTDAADDVRERAGELYERTAGGFRRVTRKASEYGQVVRDAVRPDGTLLNFCREQPMLVAGLGVALGAALAAMIPASRVERQTMGETSRKVQDRVKEAASETWQTVSGAGDQSGAGAQHDDRGGRAANDGGSTATQQSNIGRSEKPSQAKQRKGWDSDAMGSREAAADVERGVRQSDRASNIEAEPERAPYAEAAEAGAAGSGATPGQESKQRT